MVDGIRRSPCALRAILAFQILERPGDTWGALWSCAYARLLHCQTLGGTPYARGQSFGLRYFKKNSHRRGWGSLIVFQFFSH